MARPVRLFPRKRFNSSGVIFLSCSKGWVRCEQITLLTASTTKK